MLTEGNLQLTNNYLRRKGRNPNTITLAEKKNIYNAHLKPLPIKIIHNLINKVSKNTAIQKLVSMGFDENRVKRFLNGTKSPIKTRAKVKNLTGYNIYTNREKLRNLTYAVMNISRGKKVDIKKILSNLGPVLTKLAKLVGFTNTKDIISFRRIIAYLVANRFGDYDPDQKHYLGKELGKELIHIARAYSTLESSGMYKNLVHGVINSGAPRKLLLNFAKSKIYPLSFKKGNVNEKKENRNIK